MAYIPQNDDIDNFDPEKWLRDALSNPDTDVRLIEDANRCVDEELQIGGDCNFGGDNEVVNLGRNPTRENEVSTGVSQNSEKESWGQTSPKTDEVILKHPKGFESSAPTQPELPVIITELLTENEPCSSGSGFITNIRRDPNKEASSKSLSETTKVQRQLPCHGQLSHEESKLPTFIEGLLKSDTCSSGKRKVKYDGNCKSEKKVCKTSYRRKATESKCRNDEEEKMKKHLKKEREKQRAKDNRAKKKQLDADNNAKTLTLSKEVDDLKSQNAQKDEEICNYKLQISNLKKRVERLEHEKESEIIYLKKKVQRLEHEKEEKDAEINLLKTKLEYQDLENQQNLSI